MSLQVVMGAQLTCSFGAAPSVLVVLPVNRTLSSYVPAANIMDHIPMVNIMSFGMCSSLTNPVVATATTAASGVLTPMPCIPVTPAPWAPGSPTVLIANMPALNATSKCMCAFGGVIEVANAGQATEKIP